jgi:hypothetical protein
MTNWPVNKPKVIDLTLPSTPYDYSWSDPVIEESGDELQELTPRELAVMKFCWTLTNEEKRKLSHISLHQSYSKFFLSLIRQDKNMNDVVKIGSNVYRINYMSFGKNWLTANPDKHILISCRINWKSKFYECLVRIAWELSEEQKLSIRNVTRE